MLSTSVHIKPLVTKLFQAIVCFCVAYDFSFLLRGWMLHKEVSYLDLLSGKSAVLEVEISSYEKESGVLLCMQRKGLSFTREATYIYFNADLLLYFILYYPVGWNIFVWFNRMALYLRGAGGFSKSSQPYSFTKYPSSQTSTYKIPKSQPFAVFEERTHPSQVCGILYIGLDIVISLKAHEWIRMNKW